MLTPGSIVWATEPDQRVGNEEGIRDLECDLLLTSKLISCSGGDISGPGVDADYAEIRSSGMMRDHVHSRRVLCG